MFGEWSGGKKKFATHVFECLPFSNLFNTRHPFLSLCGMINISLNATGSFTACSGCFHFFLSKQASQYAIEASALIRVTFIFKHRTWQTEWFFAYYTLIFCVFNSRRRAPLVMKGNNLRKSGHTGPGLQRAYSQ